MPPTHPGFAAWSVLFFLIPLALAWIWGFYALAIVLSAVIIFAFLSHVSGVPWVQRINGVFAWILMGSHLLLCALGGFAFPYFPIVLLLVALALHFHGHQSRREYDLHHGLWHLTSAAISVASQLTYLAGMPK